MCSPYSVSEIKMEDILAVLGKDDCFKRRQRGAQVSGSYSYFDLDSGVFICGLFVLPNRVYILRTVIIS